MNRSILLVDDEDAVRMIIRRLLQKSGFRVIDTGNPVDALQLFSERDDWDLLITDLMMPHLKGWELASHIRRLQPKLPILFISGYPGDQVLDSCGGNGGGQPLFNRLEAHEAFLRKPFSMEELARVADRLIAFQTSPSTENGLGPRK